MIFDIENFPTSPKAKRMVSHLPKGFYDTAYVAKWLFQVMGLELDDIMEIMEELPYQAFIETATWGLGYHEFKWGLPVYTTDNYEERRQKIYEKRDYRAPMTPYKMEQHLQNMTGYRIQVSDVHDKGDYDFRAVWFLDGTSLLDGMRRLGSHPNRFQVNFIGNDDLGTIDMQKIRKVLNRIKQSHTDYYVRQTVLVDFVFTDVESITVPKIKIALGIVTGEGLDAFVALPYKIYEPEEVLVLGDLSVLYAFFTHEGMNVPAIGVGFRINFFGCMLLDGTWTLNGASYLNSTQAYDLAAAVRTAVNIENEETLGNGTVERFSRNYWVLDDTVILTGSRILDSVYEKEDL